MAIKTTEKMENREKPNCIKMYFLRLAKKLICLEIMCDIKCRISEHKYVKNKTKSHSLLKKLFNRESKFSKTRIISIYITILYRNGKKILNTRFLGKLFFI
jgi:hypothetical protein